MQKCGDLLGHLRHCLGGMERFKRTGRHGDGLGNKLQTENDSGVMLLVCSLLERHEKKNRMAFQKGYCHLNWGV